uniref:Ig-like domain-containing protein n=1 Tax=Glossina brevipalpis TaxID=37001 RepID=A0A1A9WTL6_9MUSC
MRDLRFNRFEELPANAFEGLTQVTTLFLNENEISYVEESAFDGLKSLRFLYLNNNRISRLPSNIFQQLKQLEAIYLDNNDIWQIDTNTFNDLPRLNRLFIFNNKLTNIPVNAFNRLPSLKRLRLDGNPIDCNCGVYSLWRHHQQHPQRKAIIIALTCETPASLYRYGFSNLQEYHFHCKKPEIITAPHDMHITTGETVELPNTDNNGVERHSSSSSSSGSTHSNNNNIWHTYAVSSDASTRGPIANKIEGLIEQVPPHFIHTPKDHVVAVSTIESVRLDCAAVGVPAPEIQWYFNGRLVAQSTDSLRIQANGSLVIVQPSLQMTGNYRCLATNPSGSIQANAKIEVKELPEILMAPQNQTIKIGKSFVLECDADGNPIPSITWQFNGAAIVVSEHLTLENENTELIVNNAKESDSGLYTCIAENESGRATIAATVTVEKLLGIPRILIEPFNLEAFTGTTIELPCKAEEPSGIKVNKR